MMHANAQTVVKIPDREWLEAHSTPIPAPGTRTAPISRLRLLCELAGVARVYQVHKDSSSSSSSNSNAGQCPTSTKKNAPTCLLCLLRTGPDMPCKNIGTYVPGTWYRFLYIWWVLITTGTKYAPPKYVVFRILVPHFFSKYTFDAFEGMIITELFNIRTACTGCVSSSEERKEHQSPRGRWLLEKLPGRSALSPHGSPSTPLTWADRVEGHSHGRPPSCCCRRYPHGHELSYLLHSGSSKIYVYRFALKSGWIGAAALDPSRVLLRAKRLRLGMHRAGV